MMLYTLYAGDCYFGSVCWCGNTQPFSERSMTDCERLQKHSSRIYFNPNSSECL